MKIIFVQATQDCQWLLTKLKAKPQLKMLKEACNMQCRSNFTKVTCRPEKLKLSFRMQKTRSFVHTKSSKKCSGATQTFTFTLETLLKWKKALLSSD